VNVDQLFNDAAQWGKSADNDPMAGLRDLLARIPQRTPRPAMSRPAPAFATQRMADGGIATLNKPGMYLGGPTDGMRDDVPATVDGEAPVRLSDGEFVIPADVVSHLGNGNSEAGAQSLYEMMDRVRKARTGEARQSPAINPNQMLPR